MAAVGIAGSLLFSPLGSIDRSVNPPVSSTTRTVTGTSAPSGDDSSAPTAGPTTASEPPGSTDTTPVSAPLLTLTSMEVKGAAVVAGSATQRRGDARSVFEVSRGQQVALALTFSNADASREVRVGAQLRCRDETGAWGETQSEITTFRVPEGDPRRKATGVWDSKPIVVPLSCRVGSDSDEPDGEISGWADSASAGSPSNRAEIVAELTVQ